MVLGRVRTVASVIDDLLPGTLIYTLGQTEPTVVTMIFGNKGLITNTGQLLHEQRLIRTVFEWRKEFEIDWDRFCFASNYSLDIEPYCSHFFREGGVIILRQPESMTVRVEVMALMEESAKVYVTEEGELLPFTYGPLMFDTGVTCYPTEIPKPA